MGFLFLVVFCVFVVFGCAHLRRCFVSIVSGLLVFLASIVLYLWLVDSRIQFSCCFVFLRVFSCPNDFMFLFMI